MERVFSRFLPLTVFIAFSVGLIAGMFGSFLTSLAARIPASAPTAASTTYAVAAASDEWRTIRAVKRASPAVVAINITKEISRRPATQDDFDQFFNDPFFPFAPPSQRPKTLPDTKQKMRIGGGSGFFVSADGLLVTNRHVVADDEAEYTVLTQDGKKLTAKVSAVDPVLDLAILKVDGTGFPFLELGDSDRIEVGQTVVAIGYALAEFRNSVTKGVISGINRRLVAGGSAGSEILEEALQIDAPINPGNSGGPLINLDGGVLGMNTAVSQNGQSLGFALPVNAIKRSIESVKKQGRIVRPWIGVRYIQLSEDFAKEKKLSYGYGALILRGEARTDLAVIPGSPADKAGLQENDIILELNGQRLDPEHSLANVLSRFAPGENVKLKIASKGKEKEVKLTLEERK